MPLSTAPEAIIWRASAVGSSDISDDLSAKSRYSPSTSVIRISFVARSATASAAAAVSALTLYAAPSGPMATDEMTGI